MEPREQLRGLGSVGEPEADPPFGLRIRRNCTALVSGETRGFKRDAKHGIQGPGTLLDRRQEYGEDKNSHVLEKMSSGNW